MIRCDVDVEYISLERRLLAGGNRLLSQISVRTSSPHREHTMQVSALLVIILVKVQGETFSIGYLAGGRRVVGRSSQD